MLVLALACERPVEVLPRPPVEELRGAVSQARARPVSGGGTRWVRSLTGAGRESAAGLAHDARGNRVVAFNSDEGVMDLFGPLLVAASGASTAGTFVVAKYGTGGERMWSLTQRGFAEAVTVSSRGHVIVAGRNLAGADFGGRPLPAGRFLLKLGREGDFQWARGLASLGVSSGFEVQRVETDPLGNAVLVGTRPDAALGGVPMLVKVDAKGDLLWTYAHEGPGQGLGVAADSEGHLYMAGLLHPPHSPRVRDTRPFLLKLDARGKLQWEQRLATRSGRATGVAVHGNRVLVTGWFGESLTFKDRVHVVRGSGSEAFVAAFDSEGAPRWLRDFGFQGLGIDMDDNDGAVVIGRYEDGDDLGAGPMAGVPGSTMNLFMAKLDRVEGSLRWARSFAMGPGPAGDSSVDRYFVASARKGESTFLGTQLSEVDLGTGVLRAPGGGSRELFLGGFEP